MPKKPYAVEVIIPMSGSFHHQPRPWHVPLVEVHHTGICRSAVRDNKVPSYTYNDAARFEHVAQKLNLISVVFLN